MTSHKRCYGHLFISKGEPKSHTHKNRHIAFCGINITKPTSVQTLTQPRTELGAFDKTKKERAHGSLCTRD